MQGLNVSFHTCACANVQEGGMTYWGGTGGEDTMHLNAKPMYTVF